ncbi:hypothetical protein [Nocardia sp. NPDC019255]|uniref:hypothetical protein n=1 Tax=Nocardia sp. NPDC019255 TaxID=3154591 RepID=UPI0033D6C1C0
MADRFITRYGPLGHVLAVVIRQAIEFMTRGALLSLNRVHLRITNLDTVDTNAPPPPQPPSTRWVLLMMDIFGEDQQQLLDASVEPDIDGFADDSADTVCDLLRAVGVFLVAETNRARARIELLSVANPRHEELLVDGLDELLIEATTCALRLRRSTADNRWHKTLPDAASEWQRTRDLEKANTMRAFLLAAPTPRTSLPRPAGPGLHERQLNVTGEMTGSSLNPVSKALERSTLPPARSRAPLAASSPGFQRALDLFHRAARSVPAYRAFLAGHGIDAAGIRTPREFAAVPPTTKANYLDRYSLQERTWEGARSGPAADGSMWLHDPRALEFSAALFDAWFGRAFGTRTTARTILVIVSFSMGSWLGSSSTDLAPRDVHWHGYRISVITPGLNPVSVLTDLAELGPKYDRVVLAGYPPFVKAVLDGAPDRVRHQGLLLLLSGGPITEAWRDHILDRLGKHARPEDVCLVYGATATSGPIASETATSIAIRRQARKDPALARTLFGGNPDRATFVQYDPEMHYIENYTNNSLLITAGSTAPLVRYRSGDSGHAWTAESLRDVLGSRSDLIDETTSPSTFLSITIPRSRRPIQSRPRDPAVLLRSDVQRLAIRQLAWEQIRADADALGVLHELDMEALTARLVSHLP